MAKQRAFDIKDNYFENIIEKPIEELIPSSMLPYSEAVIMDRALPRVEDGLKPVQRRILYAMHELNMKPDGPYKKSARVVGECLGKYHPHGDTSVYDAMVRMAQDFNMRQTLVDGHGNFGSIDGDPAAAMRYTEVKLQPLATELLRDLDKDTVRWNKNFDDTLKEPDVLPGRFPNLLVNGAMGIAIGLATNIPTHNLCEVIDGCVAMIEQPSIKLPELLKIIKGPDFPTGGFLLNEGLEEVYATGKGKIVLRAKADIENAEGDRQNIVITEIPYNVNKRTLLEKIYELKETKKDEMGNIMDVCDESDRNGMRIVIKLKKGEDAIKIYNYLLGRTDLQTNFNVNMVAIADGKPRQMGLIEILKHYLEFQRNVILNRSKHEIALAKKREHILEGYSIIMPAIDEVIAIIRAAATRAEAKAKLRERFSLSEAQAEAVLSLQLGNINKLDVTKFESELKELRRNIEKLTAIINSKTAQMAVVKEELLEIRDKYKVKRLTTIVNSFEEIDFKPYDPTKRTAKRGVIVVDADGGVKVVSSRNYLSANREAEEGGYGGLAVSLAETGGDKQTFIFGSQGNCYKADTEVIKEKRWGDPGEPLSAFYLGAPENEKAVFAVSVNPDEAGEKEFYLYTKLGMVKKSLFKNYFVSKDSYQVCVLKDGDEVIGGEFADPNASIIFVTSDGLCVNTSTEDYPSQGRIAGGVIGVSLNDGAYVVYAGQTTVEIEDDNEYYPMGEIAVLTKSGYGKKVIAREFELMKRNRKGVKIIEGDVIFASKVLDAYTIAVIDAERNVSALNTEYIRIESRTGRGKPIVRGVKIQKALKHIEEV
ncbi:MAG TPA: DNA topoisomerase 4 subunit A [Clostridia bacterium]|jgi:DNA gyrase subunit A|nr:DNA topoisomerase 4 subunit A [Clostridia bacterium]